MRHALLTTITFFVMTVAEGHADKPSMARECTSTVHNANVWGGEESPSINTVVKTEQVLVIGSSVSAGWHDSECQGGFLTRAFAAESAILNTNYVLTNHSVPGDGVTHISDKYIGWLKETRPNIVVLGWGGLDDAHDKTPVTEFRRQITAQIQTALLHHAIVLVVTPPVTRASYTSYKLEQANLINNEIEVARGFHNPNVYVFNVFDQMKSYLSSHHQTYAPYMADGWHPNSVGHTLASQLLASDLFRAFGPKAPSFTA